MKQSFFQKTFLGQLAVAAAVIVIMSAVFFVAIRASISSWNLDKKEDLEILLEQVISKSYRLEGGLSPTQIAYVLQPYLTDSLYIYIFDTAKKPILLMEKGKRVAQSEVEAHTGSLSSFLAFNPPVAIHDGTKEIAYMAVDSADFLAYKANRMFLSTMKKAILIGGIGAIICILFLSLTSASALSKKTTALADSIALFSPDKETHLPQETGLEEFDRITKSVQTLHQRLKTESNLRRQWMQDISHDLRTPITAVQMQLEGMTDGVLPASKERIQTLFSELKHIERLVCNLQDLSRYESPEMQIHRTSVEPASFLSDIFDRFSFAAGIQEISFLCTEEPDTTGALAKPFQADELLLQRCVSNIVQNALQHTAAHGNITVTLSQQYKETRRFICILITNTGTISDTDIPYIFDRLYRGDKSRSSTGSGLGLSIAQAIITLHGGTITVHNIQSKNDTPQQVQFTIKIPADDICYE